MIGSARSRVLAWRRSSLSLGFSGCGCCQPGAAAYGSSSLWSSRRWPFGDSCRADELARRARGRCLSCRGRSRRLPHRSLLHGPTPTSVGDRATLVGTCDRRVRRPAASLPRTGLRLRGLPSQLGRLRNRDLRRRSQTCGTRRRITPASCTCRCHSAEGAFTPDDEASSGNRTEVAWAKPSDVPVAQE